MNDIDTILQKYGSRVYIQAVKPVTNDRPKVDAVAEAKSQLVALMRSLVPPEADTSIDEVDTRKTRSGFNDCRTQILNAIEGLENA